MSGTQLKVTSHVARDLLQSAALFQHEHSVVWEYVSNGLEYVDPGTQPIVHVFVDVKVGSLTIRDNGRGMTRSDLDRYFQMHGENIDRKRGKSGRGMFGTGKSAAFGIGALLRLTTVRDGLRCKVELARQNIETASDGTGIPVKILESETSTSESNGTFVEIEGIHLKKMDVGSIVRHIERHIAHWPNATVFVNHQECKVVEPAYSEMRRFASVGTPFEGSIGAVELVVKIAKAPLEQEWQGIAILSKDVWHATTLAGCDGKPFANYIFGEIDVPRIADDKSPIAPFDMSRSMRLNLKNETVGQVYAFIGSRIETVRRELEQRDRDRKKERDAQRLSEEATAIARIINADFDAWRNQVKRTVARAAGGSDRLPTNAPTIDGGEGLSPGSDLPAIIVSDTGGPGGHGGGNTVLDVENPRNLGPQFEKADEATEKVARARKKAKTSASGGFSVDFINMGQEAARAKYEREQRTIYVNLDHPQIAAALTIGGITDVAFRRLSYEVAFSEYAIALSSELASGDWYHDITDPIVDIRDTINRISRAAASLYSNV